MTGERNCCVMGMLTCMVHKVHSLRKLLQTPSERCTAAFRRLTVHHETIRAPAEALGSLALRTALAHPVS